MLFLLLGCAAPDPSPAATLIGAAGPIAFAAVNASAAVAGDTRCAEVVVPCIGEGCTTEVEVRVDAECPLPVAPEAEGRIHVVGSWGADGTGVLAAEFADVVLPEGALRVREISAFTVSVTDNGPLVAFAIEAISFSAGETGEPGDTAEAGTDVAVEQTGFAVSVDEAGTPGDPADDRYTINGGGQIASTDGVWQVAVVGALLAPECRENPTDGFATVQDVSVATGGETGWGFHSACDGTAQVLASAGRGTAWSGKTVGFPLVE